MLGRVIVLRREDTPFSELLSIYIYIISYDIYIIYHMIYIYIYYNIYIY